MAEYKIYILDQVGGIVASAETFLNLSVTLTTNNIHHCSLTLPDSFGAEKLREDFRVEILRNELPLGDSQFIIEGISQSLNNSGEKIIQVSAAGALKILSWPIVAYNAGAAQAVKSGNADDLIKEIVDENLGGSATDTDRDMSAYLTITADESAGASVNKSFSRRNVLTVCQELAEASATAGTRVYFDIVSNNDLLELRTYIAQRGSANTGFVMSPDRQNLSQMTLTKDYTEVVNYVYAGGQGQEASRNVQSSEDTGLTGNSVWGRIKEAWRDARHVTLTASVQDEADLLLRASRPRITARGTYIESPGQLWDRAVSWGDLVTVQYASTDTESYTAHVDPVTFNVSNGVETITVGFRIEQ